MPSGYTAKIYENKEEVTAKEFIATCAKAFSAFAREREMPLNGEIDMTPQMVDTYHLDAMKRNQESLEKLQKMTLEEVEAQLEQDYQDSLEAARERVKARLELKDRYEKVLAGVHAWEPPTFDHQGLHQFAIDQLTRSIQSDCSLEYCNPDDIKKADAQEHIKDMTTYYEDRITYHRQKYAEEVERVAKRNAWVQTLMKSLEVYDK